MTELYEKMESIRSTGLSLITDTTWPPESKKAADALRQTINDLPNFPANASVTPLKDSLGEFIHVLEGVHTRIEDASEKYGKGKRGPFYAVRAKLSSEHRRRCTDTLWGCRAETENALADLRNCLGKISAEGNGLIGLVQDSDMPSDLQLQPSVPLVAVDHSPKACDPFRTPEMKPLELVSEHPSSQPAPLQNSSLGPAEDGEERTSFRDRALTVAKKTFETVEVLSGAIPGVGDFVGVAAKVGLGFVNMIENMDNNEEAAKELTSHTEELSSQLEHFRKSVDAETGDQVAARIERLRKELERVQVKVNKWNSSGLFKKWFLSSDHADELKANQDTVQIALERMQLLVSLRTNDIVVELKNAALRAERIPLLDKLGDGSYGARGTTIEEVICCPGTRVQILNRIDEWIRDTPTSTNRVLWIRGMAGRGKSTIASTVAHNWSSKGLGAIFHFRRGQHVSDGQFVCALARQLVKDLAPEVKNAILDCVKSNPDIATERLEQQFQKLFVGALGKIQHYFHPIVIVVDALDECEDINVAVSFVRLIGRHSTSLPANVKFLLTCRPEPPLILALELGKWRMEDLDSVPDVAGDIKRFIERECTRIRDEHELPQTWPWPTDLSTLVEMSQGIFQWARTAIAYISNRAPDSRLQELLQNVSQWSGLDELYNQILSRAFNEVKRNPMRKEMLSWVLGTLVVAPYPVTLEVIAFLHTDHKLFTGQDIVRFLRSDILVDLNSLLYIPESASEPVRLMHTSIRDLLTDQERCDSPSYSVDPIQDHRRLATVCLEIIQRALKQNICNLPRVPWANSEIQDAVSRNVPSGLQYCCCSWSTHLVAGFLTSDAEGDWESITLDRFKVFSDVKILCWLEVMSLLGAVSEAYTMAKQVHQWLLKWPADISDDSLNTLWNDIQRFITGFFEPISSNALGIYASALPQCPVETQLWLKYRSQATAWIVAGKRVRNWSANIWTASAASDVATVAFSPDGTTIGSGSGRVGERGVIQLWDARTGGLLGDPLTGHKEPITCIVFSPDGKVLASGSGDKTVRLWDVQTGASLCEPLTGHRDWVRSIVFSPDGKAMASGSDDKTVRLWDPQAEVLLGEPLTGHSNWVRSVVFSPDGKILASGSHDKTIRLWDVQTGVLMAPPLTGHCDWIMSVVFSPDGRVLASGSNDKTVRLWDGRTGAPLGHPLAGHSDRIRSVAFSPDGKLLASGSHDRTVRLWDVQTRAPLGDPLTGHGNLITSVMFSPDSIALASGSEDQTVRLWDVQTGGTLDDPPTNESSWLRAVMFSSDGKALAVASGGTVQLWDAQTGDPFGNPLTGHSNFILFVIFSPDGKTVAVGSADGTIQLWDAQTGAQLGHPLTGHSDSIMTVAFAPDSKVLASGSEDKTVRLWDARAQVPLGDPLSGHRDSINSVAFSPNGKLLASGSDDKTVRFWDVRTRAPFGSPMTGHKSSIRFVAFSPDGKIIASGSDDDTIRLWDPQAVAPLGSPLTGHSRSIRAIVFSPDSKVLASGSYDNTVRLWDVQTGALRGDPLTGHSDFITSIVFSPDGKVLASVSTDCMIRFWDPLTLKSLLAYRPFDLFTC